jgi:succinate-semialdehyde dehydrogenase / glutarate-semialdehyde dehydrogenase
LAAVKKGFQVWSKASAYERAKQMRTAAAIFRQRVKPIARNLTREQGKPLGQSHMEVAAGADIIDWFTGEAHIARSNEPGFSRNPGNHSRKTFAS